MKQPSNNLALRVPFLCLFAVFFACLSSLKAQDPALSQFFANRVYLNPAFTGMEEGLQFTVSSRNQWYAADKGYSFVIAGVDWQEPYLRSGFGLQVRKANEGIAPLSSVGAGLTYAYVVPIQQGNLHLGLQYDFNQKSLDWSKLVFSDQLDPVFGKIYSSAATMPANESIIFHDFAFGAIWRWDSHNKSRGETQHSFRSHLGLTIHHLPSLTGQGPDESFLRTNAAVPARITIHGGTIIPLTFLRGVGNDLVLSPNFRFESQGVHPLNLGKSLTLFTGGLYVIFQKRFTTGLFYQSRSPITQTKNTNSILVSTGFSAYPKGTKKDNFYFGISVDVNTSGLGLRSNNIYELNMRYSFKGMRPLFNREHQPKPVKGTMKCPHFAY